MSEEKRGWMGARGQFDGGDEDHYPEAKELSDLLCPVHASLDSHGKLAAFDNCIACIRVQRDELLAAITKFRLTAGRHEGEHDQNGGVHCSKCIASYNAAEGELENATR